MVMALFTFFAEDRMAENLAEEVIRTAESYLEQLNALIPKPA
jgi:hypothetical protein